MTPFDLVESKLPDARRAQRGRAMARCPAHKDRRRSLSVREFDSGVVGLKCFAGCEVETIVASLGLQLEDLFPPKPGAPGGGRQPERKPFSARQVLEALRFELNVVWVVLSDIASGRDIDAAVRARAGKARARCIALIDELRLAQ